MWHLLLLTRNDVGNLFLDLSDENFPCHGGLLSISGLENSSQIFESYAVSMKVVVSLING